MKIKNSVECWVINSKTCKVLLLQCPETEKHKKYWQPVTGGIEKDEKPLDACVREVFEETGLTFRKDEPELIIERIVFKIPEEDMELVRTVFIVYTELEKIVLSSEHLALIWELPEKVDEKLLWNSNKTTFEKVKKIIL